MRRIHIALAVDDLQRSIDDYSERLGAEAAVIVPGRYALWRTPEVNLSVSLRPGGAERLRHLGFEDDEADAATETSDVNGIVWEHFTAAQQASEIEDVYGPEG
ncbi:MAG TPA: VOC family protein [Acidimicrobiales bacterium]|nr:VOC family protein [Acidimicrobiales bacterium]